MQHFGHAVITLVRRLIRPAPMALAATAMVAALVGARPVEPTPSTGPTTLPTVPPAFATTRLSLQVFNLAPKADNPAQPIIVHLPGISGFLGADRSLLRGLREAGLSSPIKILNWPSYAPGFTALISIEANREQAQRVAQYLRKLIAENPSRPVVVTCHSGGAGIIVWALEQLPEGVMIDRVVFLAPALSPDYDLSPALTHVRSAAVVFSSTTDLLLDKMTPVFGTIDRIKTRAAGYDGFHPPAHPAIEGQYAKLVQLPHRNDWLAIGNNGDHIGPLNARFVRAFGAGVVWPPLATPSTQPAPLRP